MQLKDFATLADAKLYTQSTLKSSDARMLNERGIFSLIGLADGEVLMQAIEGSTGIPARVKSWFKPSEQGIDIADPNALGILAGMVAANVLTQANSDLLSGYAYVESQPFATSTKHDFEVAKDNQSRFKLIANSNIIDNYLKITTIVDCEAHRPNVYKQVHGKYIRVTSFPLVEKAGDYTALVNNHRNLYVDNVYNVVS